MWKLFVLVLLVVAVIGPVHLASQPPTYCYDKVCPWETDRCKKHEKVTNGNQYSLKISCLDSSDRVLKTHRTKEFIVGASNYHTDTYSDPCTGWDCASSDYIGSSS